MDKLALKNRNIRKVQNITFVTRENINARTMIIVTGIITKIRKNKQNYS